MLADKHRHASSMIAPSDGEHSAARVSSPAVSSADNSIHVYFPITVSYSVVELNFLVTMQAVQMDRPGHLVFGSVLVWLLFSRRNMHGF